MDRSNGVDNQAPPRPPKFMPLIHRPKIPERTIMNANLEPITTSSTTVINNIQSHITTSSNSIQPISSSQVNRLTTTNPNTVSSGRTGSFYNQHTVNLPTVPTTFIRRRPHAPSALPIPTLSQTVQNFESSPTSQVTLAQPRPESERLVNEYVDTPLNRTQNRIQPLNPVTINQQISSAINDSNLVSSHDRFSNTSRSPNIHYNRKISPEQINVHTIPSRNSFSHTSANSVAIVKQPTSFTKGQPVTSLHENFEMHPSNGDSLNSITCPQCKRCRCEECQKPRQLPSKWICGDMCLCSSETIIDYSSCLCCVKALYYHCSKDHELEQEDDSISCADDPCSCSSYRFFTRWSCLGVLSIFLPCLYCYWPMRGCVNLCGKCYAKYTRHGCRCSSDTNKNIRSVNSLLTRSQTATNTNVSFPSGTSLHDFNQEKRLLDSGSDY